MKILKRILMIFFGLLVLLIVGIALFINTAPQFGKAPSGADLERVSRSIHYQEGTFVNLIETKMDIPIAKMPHLLMMFFNPPKNKNPKEPIPTEWELERIPDLDTSVYLTWYGHSAVKLELEGKTILIDPMLGEHASPVSFATGRFAYEKEIDFDQFEEIEVIVISHDHYDHLDHASILKLKDKTKHFVTPLGVGSHLKHWGVEEEKITELDWWEEVEFNDVVYTAAPARHFSGRGIFDRNKTQWASWAIRSKWNNVYFSGDGGYGPHFKEIGEKLGPFDFAMLECGQYNKMWEAIHMMPEQSVQAGIDVKGELIMPIHWGAFDLAPHNWLDPIERFSRESENLGVPYVSPVIGSRLKISGQISRSEASVTWWKM